MKISEIMTNLAFLILNMPKIRRTFSEIVRSESGAKACKSCRSRQELSTSIYYYSVVFSFAKFGFDTAEKEPLKVCQKFKISRML